jgi:hypothetical protein
MLSGYSFVDRYIQILESKNFKNPKVIDLNYLFSVLIGIVDIYTRLLNTANCNKNFYVKAKILNAWRTTPFLDIPLVLDRFDANCPPMCFDSVIISPSGYDPDSFVDINKNLSEASEEVLITVKAQLIFTFVAGALGIPVWIDCAQDGDGPIYSTLLFEAGSRSIASQRLRNASQN